MLQKICFRSALALAASGLAACAVYDASLLQPSDGVQGDAGQSAGGSTGSGELGGDSGLGATGGVSADAGNGNFVAAAGHDSPSLGGASSAAGGGGSFAGMASGGHSGALGSGGHSGAVSAGGVASSAGAPGNNASGSGGTTGVAGSLGIAGNAGNAGSMSTAGSGGSIATPLCADHPITAKATWVASASHQSTTPKNLPSALTDNTTARWSSGKPQSGDEWLQVDFGATVNLRGINLQQGSDTNDYPRSYAVYVSDTNGDLSGIVRASGVGTSGVTTTILLPKIFSGQYLLIKQLGSSLSWWSVAEIEVSCVDN